jgi:hypothetical protein
LEKGKIYRRKDEDGWTGSREIGAETGEGIKDLENSMC